MGYISQIIETEAQPVLLIGLVTSVDNLPNEIGRVYSSIIAYLAEKGEQPLGPAFIAYYNMDLERLKVEIGFPVEKEIAGKGDIVASQIPAGKKATCFYKGPYSDIESSYENMEKWINDRGYVPTGVVYEFYYNSPVEVPESELLTKIEFLLN